MLIIRWHYGNANEIPESRDSLASELKRGREGGGGEDDEAGPADGVGD